VSGWNMNLASTPCAARSGPGLETESKGVVGPYRGLKRPESCWHGADVD
jgi:hypothetical protein